MKATLVRVDKDPITGRFIKGLWAWQVPNGPRILMRGHGGFPPGTVPIEGIGALDLRTGEIR